MSNWGTLYRDNVSALVELAPTLSEEQLASPVPATPDWTVHRLLAHLAGVSADAVAGRMDGAPGPEWTSRHVAERQDLPAPALVAELEGNAGAIAASIEGERFPAAVFDIAAHHADLHEALDLHRMPERLWRPVVDAHGPHRAPDLMGTAPDYEVFRILFSRRSRQQIRAWGVLDDEAVEKVGVFGARDDDQPVPA